jgi:hypothetical protein
MEKMIKLNLIICVVLFFTSCATSMAPIAVYNTLPTLTKSTFVSQAQAEECVNADICKYLVKGRKYTAPIGFTLKGDLNNAAKGIDEWVTLDGGNAYVLVNYKWVTVDHNGTTQLDVEFDTMLYN